jgi:hypothetical protein
MKVRCVKLLDSRSRAAERSAWAKIGSVYHVLSIWVEPGQTRLRLVGEESTPALFEPEMFEVISSAIPPNWVITSTTPGCLSLAPDAWNTPGFWERFFDADADAIAVFNEERAKIVAADP